jgi:WD40 repeat protein
LLVVLMVVAAFGLGVLLRKASSNDDASQPSTQAELAMLDVAIDSNGLERVVDTDSDEVTAALVLKRELVTAENDGVVRVWGRSEGELLGETKATAPILALAETESSSRFLAAVDRRGAVELVDVTDPGRPRMLSLGVGLSHGERPLAIAFSKEPSEIVTLGADGEVLRVDVTTGRASRSSLWNFRGELPWRGGANGLRLTAARFVPEVYEDEEGILVATTDGAVADLDLARGQGKTILRAGVAPGRVLSLDRVPYGQPQLVVGTTEGLVFLGEEEFEDEPQVVPGLPVPAVAIDEEGLRQGGKEGLAFGEFFERPPSGPAVLRFEPGPHGIAVVHPGGRVSVLGPPGVGMSLAETTVTPVAAFDPDGRLLVAEGYDANHIEELHALRPQPRVPADEFQEDEVVQTYRPDPDWWPKAEDPEALYLNNVVADGEYVVAGGQDPNGNASVLVWDSESGKPLHHLVLETGGFSTELPNVVTQVMLLSERHEIAVYSAAQELVAIWSTETWELEDSIPIGAAGDVSVSPDESTIVAVGISPSSEDYVDGDDPTNLTFVNVEEGEVEDVVKARGVTVASLSPDGSTLAMVDQNGFLRLRSADGREPRGPLVKVGGGAGALAWRPDGKLIAVALSQGVVLVDPESGKVSEPLSHEAFLPSRQLAWTPDGSLLAALNGSPDEEGEGYDPGVASIWTLDGSSLERRMCELAACRPAPDGTSLESQLGDASQLASIEMVFREEGDLMAADLEGEKVRIGYVEGEYPTPPVSYDWSKHGLAWSSPGQVSVLLAGEERPHSWPCACSGVAWEGNQVLSLEQGGRRLAWIDPERNGLQTTPTHGVPPYLPGLLGVVGETPILTAFEREPDRGTASALFKLESDGTAVKLVGNAHGGIYLRWPSSSPRSLAFLASLSGGVCYSTTNVGVISEDGNGRIDISFPPSPLGNDRTWVRSLQVADDGTVSAAIAPIGCDDRGYPEDETPRARRYLLESGQWQPTGTEGFDVQSAGRTELIQESEEPIEPGPLFVHADGDQRELAPSVEGLVGRP